MKNISQIFSLLILWSAKSIVPISSILAISPSLRDVEAKKSLYYFSKGRSSSGPQSRAGQTPGEDRIFFPPYKFPFWGLPYGVYSNGGFFNPGLFPFVPGGPGFPPYDGVFGGPKGPGAFPGSGPNPFPSGPPPAIPAPPDPAPSVKPPPPPPPKKRKRKPKPKRPIYDYDECDCSAYTGADYDEPHNDYDDCSCNSPVRVVPKVPKKKPIYEPPPIPVKSPKRACKYGYNSGSRGGCKPQPPRIIPPPPVELDTHENEGEYIPRCKTRFQGKRCRSSPMQQSTTPIIVEDLYPEPITTTPSPYQYIPVIYTYQPVPYPPQTPLISPPPTLTPSTLPYLDELPYQPLLSQGPAYPSSSPSPIETASHTPYMQYIYDTPPHEGPIYLQYTAQPSGVSSPSGIETSPNHQQQLRQLLQALNENTHQSQPQLAQNSQNPPSPQSDIASPPTSPQVGVQFVTPPSSINPSQMQKGVKTHEVSQLAMKMLPPHQNHEILNKRSYFLTPNLNKAKLDEEQPLRYPLPFEIVYESHDVPSHYVYTPKLRYQHTGFQNPSSSFEPTSRDTLMSKIPLPGTPSEEKYKQDLIMSLLEIFASKSKIDPVKNVSEPRLTLDSISDMDMDPKVKDIEKPEDKKKNPLMNNHRIESDDADAKVTHRVSVTKSGSPSHQLNSKCATHLKYEFNLFKFLCPHITDSVDYNKND